MRKTLLALAAGVVLAASIVPVHPFLVPPASALTPLHATPPAGLSVEAKDAAFNKGFDFKFKAGNSTATISIDPLGTRHTDTATISMNGSVTLSGKYDRNDRQIEITAKRGGQDIGEFSWRVEAVLR